MSDGSPSQLGWLEEARLQLARRRHVVLHGNIRDRFPDPEATAGRGDTHPPVHELVGRLLQRQGYEAVLLYDAADGWTLPGGDAAGGRRALDEALRPAEGAAVRADPDAGDGGVATARRGAARPVDLAASPPSMDLIAPATQLRQLLRQQNKLAAAVVRFPHRWLRADEEHQSDDERRALLLLEKALEEAAAMPATHARSGRRNALILLTPELSLLPPGLYHDNPHVAAVAVPRPDLRLRRSFWKTAMPNDAARAEELAIATEALTLLDLRAIKLMEAAEKLQQERPRELVRYFKHGVARDAWSDLDHDRIERANQDLSQRVIGQDEAVASVLQMLERARGGVSCAPAASGRPKGTFFFAGPTGVGKTELAKAVAQLLFGDESAMKRFDMSEFKEPHTTARLIGSPPGYVGHDSGGELTDFVRQQPFCVLLFDEIDKAHHRVADIFLQVLDDGRLTDSHGQTAYFDQALLIFTSNIGSNTLEHADNPSDDDADYDRIRQHFQDAVEAHFKSERPELMGRIGLRNVIGFDLLRPQHAREIVKKLLLQLAESACARHGLKAVKYRGIIDRVLHEMHRTGAWKYGGRELRNCVEALPGQALNAWIVAQRGRDLQSLTIRVTCDNPEGDPYVVLEAPGADT